MFFNFLIFSVIAGLSNAACLDSNDQEIQGFCFKFVAQQMTYSDARNWCRYKNPAGSSYLAYVPNKDTSNYLAFYARSAFGTSAEYFWIGLSRNESSGSLSWDNGLPVVYTNLGSYLGQNYFSEKISNTKWDTLGDNSTNYFVCSYASTSDQATSTEPPTNNCQPGGQQTILFAYSNDLDPSVVTDTLINSYLSSQPVTFAVSRFDLRQPEDIGYFNTYNEAASYVSTHRPDSTKRLGDNSTGSDVLDVINKFYNNTQLSPCESVVMVLSKRYPNTTDISNIVSKVRKYHGIVNFLASNTPSGGTQTRVLFDLASKTNGIYSIESDSNFSHFIEWMPLRERYPIYAVNARVLGQGSQALPSMSVPVYAEYLLMIALQNHMPVSNVQSVSLSWYNQFSVDSSSFDMQPLGWAYVDSNSDGTREHLGTVVYNMTIDYVYNDIDVETMQVRFYSPYATDFWQPYSD
ncbi:C-type lectin domain-containing protein [Caenorhabditis elegans]|uniref:C-type lectin domain-containing protein n=1 Tax=Caenorhabditis elegans TaxID=6239 RepID=Q3LFM3_CAEEL|nr:C-type lectin domain-containing protein [Caenorhabditis elegans]CCD70733.2 C-type lectin domain-containing protein [Caenorhabditis elegans]|eukprot:NP_500438.5 C-type LECtin [Caenorhabditis elegans]